MTEVAALLLTLMKKQRPNDRQYKQFPFYQSTGSDEFIRDQVILSMEQKIAPRVLRFDLWMRDLDDETQVSK